MSQRLGRFIAVAVSLGTLIVVLASGRSTGAATTPNDPQFPAEWSLAKVRAPEAWDVTKGSSSIKVGIVDTGIAQLPDLQGQLAPGFNAITPGGSTDDDFGSYGLGTQVASIIGARTNNSLDMAGISWNVTVVPVKVCSFDGTCLPTNLASGINWAVANGAQILDISVALSASTPELDAAVANALSHGVLVVAAAGNVATRIGLPAASPGVIAVGATDANDVVASFSGRGSQLDLTAPGQMVNVMVSGGCCMQRTGTELAAAHVSGALALLLAAGVPSSSASAALLQGARDLGSAGWDSDYGSGRLDICAALSAAGVTCPVVAATATAAPTRTPTPPPPATSTPTSTATALPPTSTPPAATATPTLPAPTSTSTMPPPTATRTPSPPTATSTPVPASTTATPTPVPPSPTAVPTASLITNTDTGKLRSPSPTTFNKFVSLTGGQSLSATVAWTGRGNSVVQVYVFDPVGNIVAQGNGSGKLRSLSYQALNAGLYTIQVDLQAGKSASYTLLTTY